MAGTYIGLISGTSRDGIDAVAVQFGERSVELLATHAHPYPAALSDALEDVLAEPDDVSLDHLGGLHAWIGDVFGEAARTVAEKLPASNTKVVAIGSHGQTVRHAPSARHPFSMQIGCGARIAEASGVQTVTDFRAADIAAGGQGAPLVPPFHRWLFGADRKRVAVVNIGGIANVTLIAGGDVVAGYDTGPGNTLMDAWTRWHRRQAYDDGGQWAASAVADDSLLEKLLSDPYFSRSAPKSTGFEHFNLDWLERFPLGDPAIVQATLLRLTAKSIADAVSPHAAERVLVCGGGAHNTALLRALADALPGTPVESSEAHGLHPDWVEAVAFAWLARERLAGRPGNIPVVTGASRPVCLGSVHAAPR